MPGLLFKQELHTQVAPDDPRSTLEKIPNKSANKSSSKSNLIV
ncbi:unnamed protein product [Larinioides sclopetarius]|uniref:Uncharacterized protein n=1 Tax=Larinioides sclopetarius TaxID=280406 RepID=A0AAV2ALR1_9ARAC